MSNFASDKMMGNRARFSQESLYETIRFIICEKYQGYIALVISGLEK